MPSRRVVLLDRDGTIIVHHHYLSRPDQVALIPGAAAGLRALASAGLGLIVITNQSGIARGYFDGLALDAIHDRMAALLAAEGVRLDAIYWCPHGPDDGCACRKPGTALVEQAAREHDFDPRESFVVGDNAPDVALARNLGATAILVRTGHGAGLDPDFTVDDLGAAAELILRLSAAP